MPFAHHPHGGDDDQALGGDLGSDNAMVEERLPTIMPPPQKKAKSSFTSSSSSSPRAEEPAGEAAAAPWTAAEDEKLRDLVAKYGTDWAQMAKELPGRNNNQCRTRWINVLDPTISREPWSEDEDRYILTCFRDGTGGQWTKMSQQMVGRPPVAIRNHWNRGMKRKLEEYIHSKNIDGVNRIKNIDGVYLIGDDIEGCLRAARQGDEKAAAKAAKKAAKKAVGPWTAAEDEKLRDLVAKNGPKWTQFAKDKELPGRDSQQCRERWVNVLDPTISRAPWSEDEDRYILTCFRDGTGGQWSKMSHLMVGRRPSAISSHWNYGMKPKVEEYIRNKNIDGVNRIKNIDGVYLIGDDIEGCLLAAREEDEKFAARQAKKEAEAERKKAAAAKKAAAKKAERKEAAERKKATKKATKEAAKIYYDDEHPYSIILDHLDRRMDHLKTKLSDKKYETVKMLRGLAKNIIDSPTLDDGCTLNSYAERTIKEFVVTHLVDLSEERYKEPITDNARSGKCIFLGEYVVDKIVASLKCGLRDILIQYDYQGKVQPDKVRQLLKQIDVALEANGFKNTAKGGSGRVKKRGRDDKLYPDKVYNRSTVVKLNIEVSIEERAQLERIAIIYLVLTTGNCSNLQLVIGDSPFDGGLYIMFSKYETIADHFTAFGRQDRGIIVPEGKKIVADTPTGTIDSNNMETAAAASTAAAGGGELDLAGDEHLASPPETTHGSGDLELATRPTERPGMAARCFRSIEDAEDEEISAGNIASIKSRGKSPDNVMDDTEFQKSGQSSNILHSFDNEAGDWNSDFDILYDDDSMSCKRKHSSNELTNAKLEAVQALTAKNRAQEDFVRAQYRSHIKNELRDEQRNEKNAKKALVDAYGGDVRRAKERIEQYENVQNGSEEVMQFSQEELLNEHHFCHREVRRLDTKLEKLDNNN